jgi:hypothetical protein
MHRPSSLVLAALNAVALHIVLNISGPVASGEKYSFREPSLGAKLRCPLLSAERG